MILNFSSSDGGTPSVLQEVQVPIMENAVCQEMFRTAGHSKLILDSFLCAGYASGQKDSCEVIFALINTYAQRYLRICTVQIPDE